MKSIFAVFAISAALITPSLFSTALTGQSSKTSTAKVKSPRADNDFSLDVKGGDVKVVKVDKVITIKVDVTVVSSLPFTINAPPNAGIYFWQFPNSVDATDKGETLEINSAPSGPLSVTLKMVTADWEAKKFITKYSSIQLSVGGVEPPPPTDQFQATIVNSYITDGKPATQAMLLASLYKTSGTVVNDPNNKTTNDVVAVLHNAAQSLIGDSLPKTRRAIADELNKTIKAAPLDATAKVEFTKQFARVQAALELCK